MRGATLIIDTQSKPQAMDPSASLLVTPSGRMARNWIQDRRLNFSKIILDPATWDEDFANLNLESRKSRPVTPVFILGNDDGLGTVDLHRLSISGRVNRSELSGLSTATGGTLLNSQPLPIIHEGEYVGVPALDFLGVDQIPFDVHIKSPAGKCLLLARAGETGLSDRIEAYLGRGLQYLYLLKPAHQRQIDAIRIFRSILPSSTLGSAALRSSRALCDTAAILDSLQTLENVTQETWDQLSDSLSLLSQCWKDSPWSDARTVLRNAPLLDHSISVLVLALLIGRQLAFESRESVLKLGLAASFHDIGLLEFSGAIPGNESRNALLGFSPSQQQAFLNHPARGAQWIRDNFPGEALVAQAVALHHWRRDGSGFFERSGHSGIEAPRIAEIIGISEELSHQLKRFPLGVEGARAYSLMQLVENQFSHAVVEGAREALLPAIRIQAN